MRNSGILQASEGGGELAGTRDSAQPSEKSSLSRIAPYRTLDAWRGLAALWVVMLHACLPYILNGHRSFLRQPLYMLSVWGQLGVTLFFVISGYCIAGAAYSHIASGGFLMSFGRARLRRIYPPYLFALTLAVILAAGGAWFQRPHATVVSHSHEASLATNGAYWIANLTLTQVPLGQSSSLIVAWSLSYEVCFYVLIIAVLGLGVLHSRDHLQRLGVLLVGIGVLTIMSLCLICFAPSKCFFPFNLWYQFGAGALLFLAFAADAMESNAFARRFRRMVWVFVGCSLCLTLLYAYMSAQGSYAQPSDLGHPSVWVQAGTTIVLFLLLYTLRSKDGKLLENRGVKVFAHLGGFSYSIYLVHVPILPFVDAGLRRVGFTEDWYVVPYALQLLLSVAAGWLFFHFVERRFVSVRQVRRLQSE